MIYKSLRLMPMMIIAILSFSCNESPAGASGQIEAVEEAVESFRQTMLQPDQAKFEALTAQALTYGHSNGLIEDRATCIASMVDGKFKFNSIELSDQSVDVEGHTAIVRHQFFAHTHDEGKEPGTVSLKVLQVWQLQDDQWRLLARQAVKIQ
ncbi:nuclear transport factor 2 family protein [Olivibacter sp. SDN3]|uniref:nuclear transport factor 2 family protein n=1 Tax=Olivibacter sp. SDN3 TaxID=2764720 RepID=UPI0016513660|nr:nuclear transport factor 2 family protein [Olivibacter sp. SDN3]QNL48671.1 nuclear transport factor 2 family protein [Olivibacter sp. SDN3]